MKKFLGISIISFFFILGCNTTEKIDEPLAIPENIYYKTPVTFNSPLDTYFENKYYNTEKKDSKNDFNDILNKIMININNREFNKAINMIIQYQTIESNPEKQLLYYKLKSLCLMLSKKNDNSQEELSNFFELYNRMLTNYSNK